MISINKLISIFEMQWTAYELVKLSVYGGYGIDKLKLFPWHLNFIVIGNLSIVIFVKS
jgi:hypothetical protein